MLKPLIGVVLSVFILATLEGNILILGFLKPEWLESISDRITGSTADASNAKRALYILWTLGFLAGFSERFAWDFVGRAEGVASGHPAADKASDK